MMLTTKGRYAVMALVDMAANNRFINGDDAKAICLADIAKRQEIASAYLEQIFAKLKAAGLVKAVRGPGGGYLLSRKASDINIAEVIDAVEEKMKMTRCGGEHNTHDACMSDKSPCITHDLWQGLGDRIESYFENITLDDVANKRLNKTHEENVNSGLRRNGMMS